jgi:hypothetical protein
MHNPAWLKTILLSSLGAQPYGHHDASWPWALKLHGSFHEPLSADLLMLTLQSWRIGVALKAPSTRTQAGILVRTNAEDWPLSYTPLDASRNEIRVLSFEPSSPPDDLSGLLDRLLGFGPLRLTLEHVSWTTGSQNI